MGSGKSTVGRLIARKLEWKFYDSDACIEAEEKMTVSEIFGQKGEAAFRALEKKAIAKLAQETDCVIAAGGGVPLSEDNWKAFEKNSTVLWLKVRPETLLARLERGGAKTRPILKDSLSVEKISALLKEREPFYRKATLTIETDDLEVEEAAEKAVRLILPKKSK